MLITCTGTFEFTLSICLNNFWQEFGPRVLCLGHHRLLWYVRTLVQMWRSHQVWWTGMCCIIQSNRVKLNSYNDFLLMVKYVSLLQILWLLESKFVFLAVCHKNVTQCTCMSSSQIAQWIPIYFLSLQSISSTMSAITLDVWLFVSYVQYSPSVPGAWFHQDHQINLPLTFVYNTGIMWRNGIVSPSKVDLKGTFICCLLFIILRCLK